jgi:hypothetical protein
MKENFIVKINNRHNYNYLWKPIICLIISIAIVFPISGVKSIQAILSIVILFFLLYVIVISMTSENLSNELPSTLYPSLPHTGLDGISLNTYVTGMDTSKYIV